MNKFKILSILIIFSLFNIFSGCSDSKDKVSNQRRIYSDQDWIVYKACKVRVYDGIENNYDYSACSEMLKHKQSLRKYGADHSYNYWIKRLYNKPEKSKKNDNTLGKSEQNSDHSVLNCIDYGDGYYCSPLQKELAKKHPNSYKNIEKLCYSEASKYDYITVVDHDNGDELTAYDLHFVQCIKRKTK